MSRAQSNGVIWPALGTLALAVAVPAGAQQRGTENASPTLELRLNTTQTFTDNVDLNSDKRADAITRLSPGMRLVSRSGRVKGFVDYSLNTLTYARTGTGTDLRHALLGNVTTELAENQAYLDTQAVISQQSVNPLDTQSADPQLSRVNTTEVRTLIVTPRAQGRLGDWAQWDASMNWNTSQVASSKVSSSTFTNSQLRLSNGESRTLLGWSLQASHITRAFSAGRSTVDDTLRGVLTYRFTPELNAGVIGGWESNDIASSTRQSRMLGGLRLSWLPSERTQLNTEVERRFFGNAYKLNFLYRLPRSVLTLSDVRALTNGGGQPTTASLGTWYEVLDRQFASAVPDAAERDAAVMAYLNQYNLSPNAQVLQSFLSSGVTINRQQLLSYAWLLQRDTITFTLQQGSTNRISSAQGIGGALDSSSEIRQHGFGLTLSHRLTPVSAVTLGYTQRQTSSTLVQTTLRSLTAQWSTQLNSQAKFSLLGRHARFSGSTESYTESALIGTLGIIY